MLRPFLPLHHGLCGSLGLVFFWLLSSCMTAVVAQENITPADATPKSEPPRIQIADQPQSIDARHYLHPKLSQSVSFEFHDASLQDVAKWLSEQTGFLVVIDEVAFSSHQKILNEPISDTLKAIPIYRFLDRLSLRGIRWMLTDDMIYFRPTQGTVEAYTEQYDVSALLANGYDGAKLKTLTEEISQVYAPGNDEQVTVDLLGELLFVRHYHPAQRRIACLLKALETPARRIWINEPQEHQQIRDALESKLTIQFKDTPLSTAVQQLSQQAGIDIRIDEEALVRGVKSLRTPINLEIRDHKLRGILNVLTAQQLLDWGISDGILWITTPRSLKVTKKVALFDVRDLCTDEDENNALRDAIQRQITPDAWTETGGSEIINFPKTGIMIVTHEERHIEAMLKLLEQFRVAIRSWKRTKAVVVDDSEEMETRSYRMPTEVAASLLQTLSELVEPSSWASQTNPNGWGKIRQLPSWNEIDDRGTTSYSVLLIEQQKKVHSKIRKLLKNIRYGDSPIYASEGASDEIDEEAEEMGGMGGAMGGMGGMGGFGSGL